jgi:hypothetical protein
MVVTTSSRVALIVILGAASVGAQTQSQPQMKLSLVPSNARYVLADEITARVELTNLTSETLCFPTPAQDCSVPTSGWVVVTGERVSSDADEKDVFICHTDARGTYGKELDDAVRTEWVKLKPNSVYTAKEAKIKPDKVGLWKLVATYHPPTSDFGSDYRAMLESAAKKNRCTLPTTNAIAEPPTVKVETAAEQE